MKKFILTTLTALLTLAVSAQSHKWLTTIKGTNGFNYSYYSSCTDAQNNLYTFGTIYKYNAPAGTATVDINGNNTNLTYYGDNDIVIFKHDKNGHLLWSKVIGSEHHDYLYATITDNSGNIYINISASTESTSIKIGSSSITINQNNRFKVKLDKDGNYLLHKESDNPFDKFIFTNGTDVFGKNNQSSVSDNFYRFDNSLNIIENKKLDIIVNSLAYAYNHIYGCSDPDQLILKKLNKDGTEVSSKTLSAGGDFYGAPKFTSDNNNHLIMHGLYKGSNQKIGTSTLPTPVSGYGYYFAKLDANADVVWIKTIELGINSQYLSPMVDVNSNGVFVTGFINQPLIVESATYDNNDCYFNLQYDINGNLRTLNTIKLGSPQWQLFPTVIAGPNNDFYLSGNADVKTTFKDTIIYPQDSGTVFIGRFENNGQNVVKGRVFIDKDDNGVFNTGDYPLKNVILENNSNILLSSTDDDGMYTARLEIGNATVTPTTDNIRYLEKITPASYNVSFSSYNNVETDKNFAMVVKNYDDLSIDLTLNGITRPGRTTTYLATIKNHSSKTSNGTLTVSLDSKLSFVSATPSETSTSGNEVVFNINNIKPYETKVVVLKLKLSTSATINDTLCNSASVTPIVSDSMPSDNNDTLYNLVRASYDPNIKEVNKPEIIDIDEVNGAFTMEYTIHFQNTGNDTAFKVVLKDPIDEDFKLTSIEPIASSHSYVMGWDESNQLTFTFNDILLVDSNTNEPESHGFIKYQISTKENPGLGDEFNNYADIYFDYNLPIRTNTTSNRIDIVESIELVAGITIMVYPNPTTDVFTIKADIKAGTEARLEIIDLTGKLIYTETTTAEAGGLETKIDINTLPQGIYFIKVYADNEVYTAKVVKQ